MGGLKNKEEVAGLQLIGSYGVNVLLHRPASHPILSYWVG